MIITSLHLLFEAGTFVYYFELFNFVSCLIMCDTGNLIDLSSCDEVPQEKKEELPSNIMKGPYDPFEFLENEALLKGLNLSIKHDEGVCKQATLTRNNECTNSTMKINNPLHMDVVDFPDLNSESPPIGMKSQADNNKRQRLLANGSLRRCTIDPFQNQLVKLSISNSPITNPEEVKQITVCDNTFNGDACLAAESPCKLVEDDASSITESNSKTNFEADLNMLRIPMLDKFPKLSDENNCTQAIHDEWKSKLNRTVNHEIPTTVDYNENYVNKLLQDLKDLVRKDVEKSKKDQFDVLIESLSVAVCHNPLINMNSRSQQMNAAPQPYKRQVTFDIDLQNDETKGPGEIKNTMDTKISSAIVRDLPSNDDRERCGGTKPPLVHKEKPLKTQLPDENVDPLSSKTLLYRKNGLIDMQKSRSIPIKQAPCLTPLITLTDPTHSTSTISKNSNTSHMQSRLAKLYTSTPMSQMRFQPRTHAQQPVANRLNVCSTPTVRRKSFSNKLENTCNLRTSTLPPRRNSFSNRIETNCNSRTTTTESKSFPYRKSVLSNLSKLKIQNTCVQKK